MAADNLPKPSFNAFKLLHELGVERIAVDSNSALVTRRPDGTVVIAAWNLFLPEEGGESKDLTFILKGIRGARRAVISRVDQTHGSLAGAYEAMGSPIYPTSAQIKQLRQAAKLPSPEIKRFARGELTVELPPQGLALIEVR